MGVALAVLGGLFCVLAVVGGLYAVAAGILTRRFLSRAPGKRAQRPPMTLLRPLHGAPPGLESALESLLVQDGAGAVQLVSGLQGCDDPAQGVVEGLITRHPDADITLVVEAAEHGANRKVSNLINMEPAARHDLLVLSDADIVAPPDYLDQVAGALSAEGTGAVTCLYAGLGQTGGWSRLAAMALSYNFLPNAVLGVSIGLATPCFGSTIALTRQTLERIGGFAAFRELLADDYEIGRAVRALGLKVAIPPMTVTHQCVEANAGELVEHEVRWGRTVRLIDPAGFAGSLVTHPLPLALLGVALQPVSPFAWGAAGFALVARLCLKGLVDSAVGRSSGPWWLLPARDVLSFAIFLASLTGAAVGWQGKRLRVGRDGVLLKNQG